MAESGFESGSTLSTRPWCLAYNLLQISVLELVNCWVFFNEKWLVDRTPFCKKISVFVETLCMCGKNPTCSFFLPFPMVKYEKVRENGKETKSFSI